MEEVLSIAEKLLTYHPLTGEFIWKSREGNTSFNARYAGKIAGTITANGYIQLPVTRGRCTKRIPAHRLAWFIVYKEIPDQVDHINHVRNDNRIENLRNVSPTENGRNKDLCSDNKSGVNGVSWHKRDKRWRAHIVIARKQIHLGNFINKEDAIAARFAADKEIGFHPNHGKIRENEEYNGKCNS